MSDTLPNGEEPQDPEEPSAEALADELNLGLHLSPEEQEAAEQMVRHLEAQFKDEAPEVVAEDGDGPEPETAPDPDAEPTPDEIRPAAEAPAARGVVVVDGVEVPVEEAVAYLTKREAQRQAEAIKPEPTPEPVKPPEWLDQDDPAQVAMWARQQELEAQVRQIGQNQQQVAQQQAVARATADANAGISTFRSLHPELSEDDITTLRTHAVSLDIIDGLARTRSGPDAIAKALDIAYWDHPEFRAQATAAPSPAEAKKTKAEDRKGKLNALGGSSGSVQRRETQPDLSTDAGAKAAAAQWLKDQNIL